MPVSRTLYRCDVCRVEFANRDDKGNINPVGGLQGFCEKTVVDPKTKRIEKKLLQYDFVLCEEHNKQIIEKFLEMGGEKPA